MPVCSTTRVKSATVFSLMIDGSGSFDCRIFGRLRPVRIVRKRGVMAHQSARRGARQNRPIDWAWNSGQPQPIVDDGSRLTRQPIWGLSYDRSRSLAPSDLPGFQRPTGNTSAAKRSYSARAALRVLVGGLAWRVHPDEE